MTREKLYELMEDGNSGYACVFKREDQGMHTDYTVAFCYLFASLADILELMLGISENPISHIQEEKGITKSKNQQSMNVSAHACRIWYNYKIMSR